MQISQCNLEVILKHGSLFGNHLFQFNATLQSGLFYGELGSQRGLGERERTISSGNGQFELQQLARISDFRGPIFGIAFPEAPNFDLS